MATLTTNFDKIWQSNDGEEFSAYAFNFFTSNFDKVFQGEELLKEQFDQTRSETSSIRDAFQGLTTQESVSVQASSQAYNPDRFNALADSSLEQIEKLTIGWGFTSTLMKEVTDSSRVLPVVLNPDIISDSISVDYAVQNTSTAQNVTEYEVTEGITGTLHFDGSNVNERVRYLNILALTQIFAKPQRTVVIKLSNVQGSGKFWPSMTFKQPAVSGQGMYIFSNTFNAGTHFPVGTSAEDQAQKLATAWNALNPNCYQNNTGYNYKALAVATGATVHFELTPNALDGDGYFQFYNNSVPNLLVVANGWNGSQYFHLAQPNARPKDWSLTLDSEDTIIVTIDAHGPRPGTVSVFSYDTLTKRATKRGQVPTTAVSGLKEKLTSIETRLKNRGF